MEGLFPGLLEVKLKTDWAGLTILCNLASHAWPVEMISNHPSGLLGAHMTSLIMAGLNLSFSGTTMDT